MRAELARWLPDEEDSEFADAAHRGREFLSLAEKALSFAASQQLGNAHRNAMAATRESLDAAREILNARDEEARRGLGRFAEPLPWVPEYFRLRARQSLELARLPQENVERERHFANAERDARSGIRAAQTLVAPLEVAATKLLLASIVVGRAEGRPSLLAADEAVDAASAAVEALRQARSMAHDRLSTASRTYLDAAHVRARRTRDSDDVAALARAVIASKEWIDSELASHEEGWADPAFANQLDTLADAEGTLFDTFLSLDILSDAIRHRERAVAMLRLSGGRNLPVVINRLGWLHGQRYRFHGKFSDFDAAQSHYAESRARQHASAPQRHQIDINEAGLLLSRYVPMREDALLDLAETLAKRVINSADANALNRQRAFETISQIRVHQRQWGEALDASKEALKSVVDEDAAPLLRIKIAWLQCRSGREVDEGLGYLRTRARTALIEPETRYHVALYRHFGEALLSLSEPGAGPVAHDKVREAASAFDNAIAAAKTLQSSAGSLDEALALASQFNDLASLAGFAHILANDLQSALRSIGGATASVLRAAGKRSGIGPARPGPRPGQILLHLGVTPWGGFVLEQAETGLAARVFAADADMVQESLRRWKMSRDKTINERDLAGMIRAFDEFRADLETWSLLPSVRQSANKRSTLVLAPLGALREIPFHHLLKADLPSFPMVTYTLAAELQTNPALAEGAIVLANPVTPLGATHAAEPAPLTEWLATHPPADPASALLYGEATSRAFRGKESRPRFLVFGCHGRYEPAVPHESAIELADGHLTAREIALTYDLTGASLVFLAACESAASDHRIATDEGVGLAHAFLLAGAREVVSSLWRVDALVASVFGLELAELLTKGVRPATAYVAAVEHVRTVSVRRLIEQLDGFKSTLEEGRPLSPPAVRHWEVTMDTVRETLRKLAEFIESDPSRLDRPAFHPLLVAPIVLIHLGPGPEE